MIFQTNEIRKRKYGCISNFPRLWQTRLQTAIFYCFVSTIISLFYSSFIVADLRADSIPSSAIYCSHCLLGFSLLATFYWLTKASNYFRVGALGYKVRPLPLILVFAISALLWAAPVVFDYRIARALQNTASAEDADSGYIRINRVASFFDAGTHIEQFRQGPEFLYLPGQDTYSASFIKKIAMEATKPFDLFGPPQLKRLLTSLINDGLIGCAQVWGDLSREGKTNAIQQQAPSSPEEKEAAQAARAIALDKINADFERSRQQFSLCLEKTIAQTNIDKKEIQEKFAIAQRNAYLVHIAYQIFDSHSSDYRDYATQLNFAAPELKPFGLGDMYIFAGISWMLFFLSVLYVARDYVDSVSLSSVSRITFLIGSSLALFLLAFDRASPFPNNGNRTGYDIVASSLHWPALLVFPLTLTWVIATWFSPSTIWTRCASLATFLCLPIALAVESLNALNALAFVNYANGACPNLEWLLVDQLHCSIYAVWQPTIKGIADFLSQPLGWNAYWTTTGGRASSSAATSIIISWFVSYPFLQLLKREFVRPRDK